MNSGRSPRAIDEAWQQELDLSLETGESPLFDVGASTGGLEGMNGVLALWRMDAGRRDLTAPVVTAGGMSGALKNSPLTLERECYGSSSTKIRGQNGWIFYKHVRTNRPGNCESD